MHFSGRANQRLSSNFLLSIVLTVLIGLVGACGKDASILLTRPEKVTKRVNVSLERTDTNAAKIGAEIIYPSGILKLEDAGNRAVDLPIGNNLEVKISLEPGWEVEKWNVAPAGNADFDKTKHHLKVTNVQDDTQISISVRKKLAVTPTSKLVYFKLHSDDIGNYGADLIQSGETVTVNGTVRRRLNIPIGEDLIAKLNLEEDWEVANWDVNPGGNAKLDPATKTLKLSDVQETTEVSVSVRKKLNSATKKVYVRLDSEDAGEFGADLIAKAETVHMEGVSNSVIYVPFNEDAAIKLNMASDWEVTKWKPTPGGVASYDKATTTISLSKIKEDTKVSITIRKIPQTPRKNVTISLDSSDIGAYSAEFTHSKGTVVLGGTQSRSLDLPVGQDLSVKVNLEAGWTINDWSVGPDANADLNKATGLIKITDLQSDTRIKISVGKIPVPTRNIYVKIKSLDTDPFTTTISEPNKMHVMEGVGEKALELPVGSNLEVKLNLGSTSEIQEWNVTPGGNVHPDRSNHSLMLENIKSDTQISVVARKIPRVPHKKIYFTLECPDKGKIYADVKGIDNPFIFGGAGERVFEIPSNSDLDMNLTMPHHWEVQEWKVSKGGDYDPSQPTKRLLVKNVKDGLVISAKIRRMPNLKLTVRAAGEYYKLKNGKKLPGSGTVRWKIYPPGTSLGGKIVKWDGEAKTEKDAYHLKNATPVVNEYPNGSLIRLEVEYIGADGKKYIGGDNILLDENKKIDIDFKKLGEAKALNQPLWKVLELNPHTQQEDISDSTEMRDSGKKD